MQLNADREGVGSKGEATRQRIIQHALELAGRVGLEGLSIGDLAHELGLSKSGLFAHFKSKERLQLDVLDTAAELFRARVFEPVRRLRRGEERLIGVFENCVKWIDARNLPGGCVYIAGAFEWDDRQGPVRQRVVEWFDRFHLALVRAAQQTRDEHQFRPDVDLEQFANDLHAILMKYHLEARLMRNEKALPRARHAFERLLAAARG
jgi:AcrR family transcriptional regulator